MAKKISKTNWLAVGVSIGALTALCVFVVQVVVRLFSPVPSAIVTLSGSLPGKFVVPTNQDFVTADGGIKTLPNTIVAAKTSSNPIISSNQTSSTGIPILMYHYVGNNPNPADLQRDILSITPDKLEEQFTWLSKNGFTPITLDTLYGIFSKRETISKPIVLTFDDGYVDFYVNAFQILRKYGFHAVAFIPTGLVGTSYYMSWDQIREINNSGLVSFQAHSVTHPNLPSLPYHQILSELSDSKKALEQQLGTHVNFISYPFGASNSLVWQAANSSGFVGGVGTWLGKVTEPGINMPRIRIAGSISIQEFINKIQR